MKWIRITNAENVPEREGRVLSIGSRPVALFNLGDRFVALENRCPHGGGPLADGIVGGTSVTCPLHNWRICLDTGAVTKPCDGGHGGVETFPVRVENGVVLLGIEEAAAAA
jgi:nitrite reductase (NADH) small subunit